MSIHKNWEPVVHKLLHKGFYLDEIFLKNGKGKNVKMELEVYFIYLMYTYRTRKCKSKVV